MGGSIVSRLSPHVLSKCTLMSKNRIEIEPSPLARHGVGPSSDPRSRTLNRPAPKTLTENEAEISMMKKNGEN